MENRTSQSKKANLNDYEKSNVRSEQKKISPQKL
jgi:hypothetical protein